jgi:hypothetical protein
MPARRAALSLLGAAALLAAAWTDGRAAQARPQEPRIADNSYLVEEAYNQERGVVQHIGTLLVPAGAVPAHVIVTQEWPLIGQRHQISFALPLSPGAEAGVGLGDVVLNYRYLLAGGGRLAVAPRFSVTLPTGAWDRGLGAGSPGLQLAVPVSARLTRQLVAHGNAGLVLAPSARAPGVSGRRALTGYVAGASLAGPVMLPVNALLEVVATSSAEVTASGAVERSTDIALSPGLRFALDVGRMQIVPGIAFPIHLREPGRPTDLFLYLSIEHAFRRGPDADCTSATGR